MTSVVRTVPKLTRRSVALALFIGLTAAACGSATTEALPSEAAPALQGEFATLDGATIDLAELSGEDVVLWFWAPW